jgi:hypothetical protein
MREITLENSESIHRAIDQQTSRDRERLSISNEYKARAALLIRVGPSDLLRNANQTRNGNGMQANRSVGN